MQPPSHDSFTPRINAAGFPGGSVVENPPDNTGGMDWKGPLEKAMAALSSGLAWRIPWTEKPGGLQSMGSHRVRHDRVTDTHTHMASR